MKKGSTGYRDRGGRLIHYGDKISMAVSAPWDDLDTVYIHFLIKRKYGGAWMEGIESNFADDYLKKYHKHCELAFT